MADFFWALLFVLVCMAIVVGAIFGIGKLASYLYNDVLASESEETITVLEKDLIGECNCSEVIYVQYANGDSGSLNSDSAPYGLLQDGHSYVVETTHSPGAHRSTIHEVVREISR